MRAKPTPEDIAEFGEDQGKPSVPALIAALPEDQREAYRQQRRAYVRAAAGCDMTWKAWMDREASK